MVANGVYYNADEVAGVPVPAHGVHSTCGSSINSSSLVNSFGDIKTVSRSSSLASTSSMMGMFPASSSPGGSSRDGLLIETTGICGHGTSISTSFSSSTISTSSQSSSRRSSSTGDGTDCLTAPGSTTPAPLVGSHSVNIMKVLRGCNVGADTPEEAQATAEFIMFSWKVVECPTVDAGHDWTTCPWAHPGEKARRRSPRNHSYQAACCPDVRRRGRCPRGEACPWAHSVFELYLHPSRFRTRMCRDGTSCTRAMCFFAHTDNELRTLAENDTSALHTGGQAAQQQEQQQQPGGRQPLQLEQSRPVASAPRQPQLQLPPAVLLQQPQAAVLPPGSAVTAASWQLWHSQQQEIQPEVEPQHANIWRAVQEAAAETGFMLCPALSPGAAVSSSAGCNLGAASRQQSLVQADAVCEAPSVRPLPLEQRAPGSKVLCRGSMAADLALPQLALLLQRQQLAQYMAQHEKQQPQLLAAVAAAAAAASATAAVLIPPTPADVFSAAALCQGPAGARWMEASVGAGPAILPSALGGGDWPLLSAAGMQTALAGVLARQLGGHLPEPAAW